MSYVRWSDTSDVYVYKDTSGGSHLREHVAEDDLVPDWLIPAIEHDREITARMDDGEFDDGDDPVKAREMLKALQELGWGG